MRRGDGEKRGREKIRRGDGESELWSTSDRAGEKQ